MGTTINTSSYNAFSDIASSSTLVDVPLPFVANLRFRVTIARHVLLSGSRHVAAA